MYKKDNKEDYKKTGSNKGEAKSGLVIKTGLLFIVIFSLFFFFKNSETIKNFFADKLVTEENTTENIQKENEKEADKKNAVAEKSKDLANESEIEDDVLIATINDGAQHKENDLVEKLSELLNKYPQSKKEISEFIDTIVSSDKSQEELEQLYDDFVVKLEEKTKTAGISNIDKSKDIFLKNTMQKGETYSSQDFDVSFLGIEEVNSRSTAKGMVLALVKFYIKNKSNDELRINRARFDLYVDGLSSSALYASDRYKLQGRKDRPIDDGLAANGKITGYLLCETPKNWNSFYIEYSPKQKNICFMELNNKQKDSDFVLADYNNKIELKLEGISELNVKDLDIHLFDKSDLTKTTKILKVDLNITNGRNSSYRVRDLDIALFVDGSSNKTVSKSTIKKETNRQSLADQLTFGRIAPRTELKTYLLCAIPDKGWEELKLSYQAFGQTGSKKQWLEWKNKKAITNK